MYGMVNQALKLMIMEKMENKAWDEICRDQDLNPIGFSAFEQYDDNITTKIITVVCKKTKTDPRVFLEDFGKFWIEYARNSEYQAILKTFATSPVELIESLDALHARLQLSFDNLAAPSFWVTHRADREILVHYKTTRDMPLQYFVVGLLKGVFKMFDQECQVKLIEPTNGETAIFQVNY